MQTSMGRVTACVRPLLLMLLALFVMLAVATPVALAQAQPAPHQQPGSITAPQPGAITDQRVANPPGNAPSHEAGGEANLKLPDMSGVSFFEGAINGYKLLSIGLIFCALGGVFGLVIYMQLKNLPVHRAMREISELIYETCKTYLITQGKFLMLLWVFIAVVIVLYFGVLSPVPDKPIAVTLPIILAFSLIGIGGSYGVAWFGIRVNTFANSRTAFAGLRGKPYPIYNIPLEAGMSIGMMLVASAAAYFINGAMAKAKYGKADKMNFEAPLTSLVWITSIVSIALTYVISKLIIPGLGGDDSQWWKLATIISCGTLAGAVIPELVKVFTSTESRHVREVVISAQEGGASLGILSGFVSGNFSGYYLGLTMVALMSIGYLVSLGGLGGLMIAAPVFAFGLVAFGFLGMGP